ncbi:MAG: ATP-binding protein [Bacteroidales bacterium]|nr:ATP-binding protein [Bacteroidales bacterium]
MENLKNKFIRLLKQTNYPFKRYLYEQINWNDRLIIIKGQRGVGKTTLILQYIKTEISDVTKVLYISLDDIYFSVNRLSDLVEKFVLEGGETIFVDEVHRYPDWSVELKNIYDFYPKLRVIATGSSAIGIEKGKADLSRRASLYHLHTLSFREFVFLNHQIDLGVFSINEIISSHEKISFEINDKIKPVELFNQFLKFGSYPFADKTDPLFYDKLKSVVNLVIDNDIPATEKITYETRLKIKKLLYLISAAVPFKPNITELSNKVGTSRDVLLRYLQLLSTAGIVNLLNQSGSPTSILQKPEKIYINNPTLMIALDENAEAETLRETFFMSQLSVKHKLTAPKTADFLVDDKYTFEVGGKNKGKKQLQGISESFIVSADIEYGKGNKIPLWMFGFLY